MKKAYPYSYTRIPSSTDVDLSQLSSLPVDSSLSPPLVNTGRLDTDQRHLVPESVFSDEFRTYLAPWLAKEQANVRPQARQKLSRLTRQQFRELSTDIYDELIRRKADLDTATRVPFLPAQEGFHSKRNQARQKLSTLPTSRYKDLCGDVFYEHCRRHPECWGQPSPTALTSGSPYDNFPSPSVPNAPSERSAHFGNTSENPPHGRAATGTTTTSM